MNRRKVWAALALAGTLVTGLAMSHRAGPATAATSPCATLTRPLEVLTHPTTTTQLLTPWTTDAVSAARAGFRVTSQGFLTAGMSPATGLVAVTRLYRGTNKDYAFATSSTLVSRHVAAGYANQGVAFYALPPSSTASCAVSVHLMVKGAVHRMVVATSVSTMRAAGWTDEGTAFRLPRLSVDRVFTFAVTPDTQNETFAGTNDRMAGRSRWLVAYKAPLDLRYSFHVGDVTSSGWLLPDQLTKASTAFAVQSAGGIPVQSAVGNHDTAAVDTDGSAYVIAHPDAQPTNVAVRDTTAFNRTFPVSRFPNVGGTFEPGKVDNSYATFTAGGRSWLVLTLEIWPRPAAVSWARSVVASHPGHLVIIVTHSYLNADGTVSTSNGGYGATSPRYLFDNLVKVYPNIRFVLSGHVGAAATRVDTGVNGNRIVSFLQAFHSTSNPVRLVEVDTAAGVVRSWIYAPQDGATWSAYTKTVTGLRF